MMIQEVKKFISNYGETSQQVKKNWIKKSLVFFICRKIRLD